MPASISSKTKCELFNCVILYVEQKDLLKTIRELQLW